MKETLLLSNIAKEVTHCATSSDVVMPKIRLCS